MSDSAAPGDVSVIQPPGELNPRPDAALDFPDTPLEAMRPADYAVLGFLSGLEVHQQLATPTKLFCRCPAARRVTRVDAQVLRHMRPTLSELGEYDGTALMEFKTRKEIVYQLERGSVCTYEMDDTPPFEIDRAAVEIALEIAMLCNLNLVSELHVMRKQYLDGSIPTGFQRTAMVGLGGAVPFAVPELGIRRELRIRQLSLEEDSCREVSDVGHRITFRTDRLGTPLTEVVTEPDLVTPHELQAGARLIARIARATGKVLRGPGAGRQDVNVSVAGGRRVEIKGVHHHRRLPLLVHTEAFRQLHLLRIRAELQRRGVHAEPLQIPPAGHPWDVSDLVLDAGPLLRTWDHAPLRAALDRGDTVCAVRLPGLAGLLDRPTQPGLTLAHEFAERVRVIACPVHAPFMTHSDDAALPPGSVWRRELFRALRADDADAVVLVWAPRADAATAAREILIRAQDAIAGVPAETRQARADGTTGFERILPGPDRMYPDTDTPPLPIRDETLERIRVRLPEPPWQREERYRSLGLDPRMAARLAAATWAPLFDAVSPAPGEPARRLATVLEQRIPYHARRALRRRAAAEFASAGVARERLAPLVRALERGELLPGALRHAVDDVLQEPAADVSDVLRRYRREPELEAVVTERIRGVIGQARLLNGRPADVVLRWAIGEVVRPLRGRVDVAAVRARLAAGLENTRMEATS
jgi:glutamyl-tRNA(Gln) amidotransferase subunit E